MKLQKGMRKVLLGLVFLVVLTLVYLFAAPHDTPTFTTFSEQWKWLGGVLFAALSVEHFAPAKQEVPTVNPPVVI